MSGIPHVQHQVANSDGEYIFNAYIYTDSAYPAHFHRSYELVYVFSGAAECMVGFRPLTVRAGECALFLPNEVHAVRFSGETCGWVGVFSPAYVPAFDKLTRGKTATEHRFTCDPATRAYLEARLFLAQTPPVLTLKSCLYAACEQFARAVTLTDLPGNEADVTNAILSYIASGFDADINLHTLATYLGYDYSYTSRLFRRIFGMSFTAYVNMCRIQEATAYLTDTDLSVTEIAARCGFGSVRTFNSVFRRQTGLSPRAYRNR